MPCIIKPLRSISGDKADITICRDETTYSEAINRYRSKGFYEILIQSLICGDNQEEIAVTGVAMPNGEIITHGIVHKKRIRGNGSTVFATFKPEADTDLQNGIRKFISKCGYSGIFDIEFLHNDLVFISLNVISAMVHTAMQSQNQVLICQPPFILGIRVWKFQK